MSATSIRNFDGTELNFAEGAEYFNEFGYIIIENAIKPEIVTAILDDLEKLNAKTASAKSKKQKKHVVHKCFFENSPTTVDLVADSVVSNFAQFLIRGSHEPEDPNAASPSLHMHLIHNNAFSVPAGGRGQAPKWHIDDPLQQVILDPGHELPKWVKLPVLVMTYMIWLSDCDKPENGPTYIVPGSHRFGREVDQEYAELHAIPACGKAGTAVLVNSQTWHRGCQNTSEVPRHTLQLTFGRRIIGHMFDTIMNYKMPEHIIKNRDERTLKRLGFLQGGAYS